RSAAAKSAPARLSPLQSTPARAHLLNLAFFSWESRNDTPRKSDREKSVPVRAVSAKFKPWSLQERKAQPSKKAGRPRSTVKSTSAQRTPRKVLDRQSTPVRVTAANSVWSRVPVPKRAPLRSVPRNLAWRNSAPVKSASPSRHLSKKAWLKSVSA